MIILGNYKNNYDKITKTAQWALTPKQLSLVIVDCGDVMMVSLVMVALVMMVVLMLEVVV